MLLIKVELYLKKINILKNIQVEQLIQKDADVLIA